MRYLKVLSLLLALTLSGLAYGQGATAVNVIDTGNTQGHAVVMSESTALSLGVVTGHSAVGKFGHAPSGVQTTLTDFWVLANATPTQQVWLAPTAARIHTIASTSVNDTTGGTGANSVRVTYLPDWDTAEATEVVTGNLNAGLPMTNAAVMINRMEVIPQASSTTINAGTITATAATDTTITAAIAIGRGQTEQLIYGVPSTHTLLVTGGSASMNDNNAGTRVDVEFLANTSPDVNTTVFTLKSSFHIQNYGASALVMPINPPYVFNGPCIVKVSGIANTADVDASATLSGILVENY